MPIYTYKCEECGSVDDDYRTVEKRNKAMPCPCGGRMARCQHAELTTTTEKEYAKPVYSEALGVSPSQVKEHRRLHPDVPITNDGRVIIKSHAERNRIMKRLGFHDRDGYN